jgi:hypothetical protein
VVQKTLDIALQPTNGLSLGIDVAFRECRQQSKAEAANELVPPKVATATLEPSELI